MRSLSLFFLPLLMLPKLVSWCLFVWIIEIWGRNVPSLRSSSCFVDDGLWEADFISVLADNILLSDLKEDVAMPY